VLNVFYNKNLYNDVMHTQNFVTEEVTLAGCLLTRLFSAATPIEVVRPLNIYPSFQFSLRYICLAHVI
jgi:hypothetical protein